MRQKKIPMRMCTGCGEMKPKKELVRVVKAPAETKEEEEFRDISVDLTGRKPGGARTSAGMWNACGWRERPADWKRHSPVKYRMRCMRDWRRR